MKLSKITSHRRAPYCEEHLRLLTRRTSAENSSWRAHFQSPSTESAFVFRAADAAVPMRFVERDPYVRNGLVTRWKVRVWNIVVGG